MEATKPRRSPSDFPPSPSRTGRRFAFWPSGLPRLSISDPAPTTEPAITRAPRWGLGDAALGFVAGYLLALVFVSVWAGVTGEESSLGLTAAGLLGLWTGIGAVVWWASRTKGSGSLSADFGLSFRGSGWLRAAAIGVICQFTLVPLLTLPLRLVLEDPESRLDDSARELDALAGSDVQFAFLAVLLVLGAPLFEELFYRGLLLRSLERRLPGAAAVGVSALLFGAAHIRTDLVGWLVQIPALAGVGVVFALLARRHGRLGPAIVCHGAFNLVTVVILYAERSGALG